MKLRDSVLGASAVLMSLAAIPAFAQGQGGGSGGDTNIDAFVRSQPHGAPVSNGIPVIVGNRGGEPVIQYRGAEPGQGGLEDGRIPQFSGSRGGDPNITYGGPSPAASATAPAGQAGQAAQPRPARPAARTPTGNEANIVATVQRARAALNRGNFGTASSLLEQAETAILNARAEGSTGHAEILQSVSEARAASNRRDRAGALRALDNARDSYMREQNAS